MGCDIRSELQGMYKDLRQPYEQPEGEDLFNLIMKETPQTLWPGKLALCKVMRYAHKPPEQEDSAAPRRVEGFIDRWLCPFCGKNDFNEIAEVWKHFDEVNPRLKCPGKATGIQITLENGLPGKIDLEEMSDSTVNRPQDRVQEMQSIYCRVKDITVNKFKVYASCKTSILEDVNEEWKPKKDDYYDREAESHDKDLSSNKQSKQRQPYTKRVIVHPSFYNIGYKEAEELMKNMDQGEVIIRPSSKGESRLTVTWKVCNDIYHHIDVQEQGKINAFTLGQSLWIGNEEFEDLDEIIARHINPMAAHARDLLNFKYYKDTNGGKRDVAEQILGFEQQKQPSKIHYIISASRELPSKFLLSYLPNPRSKRHEFLTVTPDGYRFRGNIFESLANLLKWFKEHYRDQSSIPQIAGHASIRSNQMHGNNTPNRHGGMTPQHIGLATNTPFGLTQGGNRNVPNPSGRTPILSSYPSRNTPRAFKTENRPF